VATDMSSETYVVNIDIRTTETFQVGFDIRTIETFQCTL
jgi:hypothetical protein